MAHIDWTDAENDLIVADYFAMLTDELAGMKYVKAHHNKALRAHIKRSRGSVEYKYQNISAVLKGMGETWINGYKPAFQFQDSLIEAVARHLHRKPDAIGYDKIRQSSAVPDIDFGPPPALQNTPEPDETERMMAIARRFDVAEVQERNRKLGRLGEKRIVLHEKSTLIRNGREDLADKVRWVSDLDGDGAGYDIASFETSGAPRLIEVKTTNGWERTPFFISKNELEVSRDRQDEWCLVRLWNFSRKPGAFEIRPPLDRHVALTPTNYRAEFGPH